MKTSWSRRVPSPLPCGDIDSEPGEQGNRLGVAAGSFAELLGGVLVVDRGHAQAYQALRDPLTGLPNRTLFADRLAVAVERIHRSGRCPPC